MAKQIILDDCGGGGCAIKPRAIRTAAYPDYRYTTRAQPCQSARKTCPVQVFFDKGQPKVRFCRVAGSKKPGHTIAVQSAEEAQRITAEACKCWKSAKGRKSFLRCEVEVNGRKVPIAAQPLGGVRGRR